MVPKSASLSTSISASLVNLNENALYELSLKPKNTKGRQYLITSSRYIILSKPSLDGTFTQRPNCLSGTFTMAYFFLPLLSSVFSTIRYMRLSSSDEKSSISDSQIGLIEPFSLSKKKLCRNSF